MTTTLYLQFPDEAAFVATLPAGFVRAGETGTPLPDGVAAIRIVDYDPHRAPGFAVNVLTVNDGAGPLPDVWKPYQVAWGEGVFG